MTHGFLCVWSKGELSGRQRSLKPEYCLLCCGIASFPSGACITVSHLHPCLSQITKLLLPGPYLFSLLPSFSNTHHCDLVVSADCWQLLRHYFILQMRSLSILGQQICYGCGNCFPLLCAPVKVTAIKLYQEDEKLLPFWAKICAIEFSKALISLIHFSDCSGKNPTTFDF